MEKTTVVEDEKHKHKPNLPVYQTQQQSWQEIRRHYIPHSFSWDTSPGNRQERVYTKHIILISPVIFCSPQTWAVKTVQAAAKRTQLLRLQKAEPLRRRGWHLVLVSDEKLKWSKELANRLRLQVGENHRPFSLIYHPTACDPPQEQFPWSVPTWACSVGSGAETS